MNDTEFDQLKTDLETATRKLEGLNEQYRKQTGRDFAMPFYLPEPLEPSSEPTEKECEDCEAWKVYFKAIQKGVGVEPSGLTDGELTDGELLTAQECPLRLEYNHCAMYNAFGQEYITCMGLCGGAELIAKAQHAKDLAQHETWVSNNRCVCKECGQPHDPKLVSGEAGSAPARKEG